MAIQNRRGDYSDFDPQKLVPGEWAVVLSGDPNSERGKAVYMAFDVGDIERMATYEDMQENIVSATSDVQAQFTSEVTQTIADANAAVSNMRDDVDAEIASATNTINALSIEANSAIASARVSTEQANQAAETAYDAAESVQSIIDAGSTVASWNNRVGLVVPVAGDYNSAQITHNNGTVADALIFDAAPTESSGRAVQSGGMFSILGDTSLGTTASTITGAIAELKTALENYKVEVDNLLTWKSFGPSQYVYGKTWATIPDNAKEIFAVVYLIWNTSDKVMINFHIPVVGPSFTASSVYTQYVNYWGTTNNGFIRFESTTDAQHRYIRLHDAYEGDTARADTIYVAYYYR